MNDRATHHYLTAKLCNDNAGYWKEFEDIESLRLTAVTEHSFLREVLFVALNSGMRAAVVRKYWLAITGCYRDFESAEAVVARGEKSVLRASKYINYPGKLRSVVVAAQRILDAGGWNVFRKRLLADPSAMIEGIPFIGPVTRWHLLRNLGADVAKPDRHLVRLVEALGYPSAQALCEAVSKATGDRVGVVDLVFWRHAERGCDCTTKEQ